MNEFEEFFCAGKVAFSSAAKAQAAVAQAKYFHGMSLKVYKCSHCDLWHLASA